MRVGTRLTWLALVAVLAVSLGAGCGGDDDGAAADDTRASTDAWKTSYRNPPFRVRVEITKDGYKPKNVKVLLGGTVTFINMDETELHTAETVQTPEGVSDDNEFDTHSLSWEEPYEVTFHKPGTIKYFDSLSDFEGSVEALAKLDLRR